MSFLAAIAPIFSVIGTGVSALGSLQSSKAQSQAAAYNAQVATNNAIIANQYAESATQAGQAKLNSVQMANRAQLGAITAAQGANNIDVNTGSAVDVRSGAREVGEVNALNTVQQAAQTAYGYRVEATNETAQAGLLNMEAQQAQTAGLFGAGGSLLSGAGSLLGNWAKQQQYGGFGTGTGNVGVTTFDPFAGYGFGFGG